MEHVTRVEEYISSRPPTSLCLLCAYNFFKYLLFVVFVECFIRASIQDFEEKDIFVSLQEETE